MRALTSLALACVWVAASASDIQVLATKDAAFPGDIVQIVCELASQKQIEDRATGEVCSIIAAEFPSLRFQPDCQTVMEAAWDAVVAKCPHSTNSPIPEDIEKLVCEVASQKQIEDRATGEVCSVIAAKFPSIRFQPDCRTVLELAWDAAVAKCPHGISLPTPKEIVELVCQLASQKQVEDRATNKVCSIINKKLPSLPERDCQMVLELAWDAAAAKCPRGISAPFPEDIEKLVCEVASQKMIEDRATGEVCSIITKAFPSIHFQPDCQTDLKLAWDAIVAKCPHGANSPIPEEIEKLVCEVASQKQIEDRATGEVCSIITAKFPKIHFQPDCQTVLELGWDAVVAKCPHGVASPIPEEIEKLVCEVASQKQIEDRATGEVCSVITAKFPKIHFQPDCQTVLELGWDAIVAKCPHGVASPIPEGFQRLVRLVCAVASQKQIEDRATDEVCSAIAAKLPNCRRVLELAWDAVVAKCPHREAFEAILV